MRREETLRKFRTRALNLIYEEAPSAKRLKRSTIYLFRLTFHMAHELSENQCLQRAAALSYTTILSLVPVTALFMLYFKMAGKLDVYSLRVQEWILRSFVAGAASDAMIYIDKFVDSLQTRALGTVGAVGMIFTTYSLFQTIEKSFNRIWNVRNHRSMATRFQILAAILILVPTLLVASLYVSGKFQELKMLGNSTSLTVLRSLAYVAGPFMLTFTSIFFLFKLLPNTTVKAKSAFLGAAVSAVMVEGAKATFNLYVLKFIPYSKIYGALGLVPVLMLWIYFSWIIVLFGVELSYTVQNIRSIHQESLRTHASNPLAIPIHEEWGVRIAASLARKFLSGEGPVSGEAISEDVRLPVPQVEDHLELLITEGWVVRVIESGLYLFSRPVEDLTIAEIENVFRKKLQLPERRTPQGALPLTSGGLPALTGKNAS